MDDLKKILFSKIDNDMKDLLNIVKCFNEDISMDFILNKCIKLTFNKRE